ncbi:MAG TPA: Gfo/Idh/MocA family oxidoreductase [Bryobacteraceae bacterium]
MIRVGVVGYGYWGPNLVRNFSACPSTQVIAIADLSEDRRATASRAYPGVKVSADYRDLLRNTQVDAVAISTPVSTHFPLAMEALKAGKHVLVEKPMTASSDQALRLIEEADRRNLILMVDHTFVYTGAVRKIREIIERGSLGEIYYYDSTRVNLGLFQHDVDVIWDLAVHDLSILDFLLPQFPVAVSATGIGHVKGVAENVAYVTAFYDSPLIAHLNVNWLSPVKVRRTLLGGSRQMIVYDDMESSEKVKLYDKGITVKNGPESVYKMLVGYRSGDMYCPQLDVTEALRVEAQHFAECIEHKKVPVTNGFAGLRVVSILEAATQSMKDRGRSTLVRNCPAAQPVCV